VWRHGIVGSTGSSESIDERIRYVQVATTDVLEFGAMCATSSQLLCWAAKWNYRSKSLDCERRKRFLRRWPLNPCLEIVISSWSDCGKYVW